MKKLFVLFAGLFLLILSVFGQDVTPPDTLWGLIANLGFYLGTPEAFAVAVPIVAAIITGLLKLEDNWPKRLVSWGVAIAGLVASVFISRNIDLKC
jgi:hypothetical protein